MKLARFQTTSGPHLGVVVDPPSSGMSTIVDLSIAAPELGEDMTELLAGGTKSFQRAEEAVASGDGRVAVHRDSLLAPIVAPEKIFGIGLNYADHIAEAGLEQPQYPTVFSKFASCITGPYANVERPVSSDQLDYEGELAFVIGATGRHVSRERASEMIAGFTIVNDLTIRDWQRRSGQWSLGKSFDTHCPIGPWIVTTDEVSDPHALPLRTIVNGEVRQESNTANLIFDCYELIEILSTACTLRPGDIVATGTPGGVGLASKPPRFLTPGDVVRVEIDGIGAIENTVVAE